MDGRTDEQKKERFIAIRCGNPYTLGLREDGVVFTWNKDGYAQISGDNRYISVTAGIRSGRAGSGHDCALREDGVIGCRGNNDYGQSSPPLR